MCNSNFCAQGVCCSTACTGTCASCALAGSLGVCSSVPAGQDPLNQCADQGVATCGTDGSCNGSGACRRYAAGHGLRRRRPARRRRRVTPNATCNASGTCVTPATIVVRAVRLRTRARAGPPARRPPTAAAPPYVCTGTTCGSATNVTVQARDARAWRRPIRRSSLDFKLFNNGTTPIPLSEMTLRYWYTIDTAHGADGASSILRHDRRHRQRRRLSFAAVSPARTNADFYLQVGFAAAAGNLGGGREHRQHSDCASTRTTSATTTRPTTTRSRTSTSFMPTTKVTAYRLGVLVYGTEPP